VPVVHGKRALQGPCGDARERNVTQGDSWVMHLGAKVTRVGKRTRGAVLPPLGRRVRAVSRAASWALVEDFRRMPLHMDFVEELSSSCVRPSAVCWAAHLMLRVLKARPSLPTDAASRELCGGALELLQEGVRPFAVPWATQLRCRSGRLRVLKARPSLPTHAASHGLLGGALEVAHGVGPSHVQRDRYKRLLLADVRQT